MRVVAGEAKGRRLVAPDGDGTRPTSDRVRESIFNALHSLDAVVGATVLDLFAGSGALGIEALSRGAARCTFVETSSGALGALQANLTATGLADRARVVRADARAFLVGSDATVDLALLDPPYAFDDWQDTLGRLRAGLIVLESDRELAVGPRWHVIRARRYGGTVVTFARRALTDDET